MKKIRFLAAVLLLSLLSAGLVACDIRTDSKVLLCYAGDSRDEFGGGVYAEAVKESRCGFQTVELGKNTENYRSALEDALNRSGDIQTVVVVGKDAYNGLADYIRSFRGMNFIVVDAGLSEIRSNVCALEFQPEEFGYLGGAMTAAAAEGDIGYISTFLNHFDNRIL